MNNQKSKSKMTPATGLYIKTTIWVTAILMALVFVFAPITPTVLGLMGIETIFGLDLDEFTGETKKSYVNVLLMGLDKDGTRSDVMMIAQLNAANNSINILQIPRDTYISQRRGDKKLNSAYGMGGPEKTISEIQTLVDIEIDNYVIVTLSGFRDVIDAVGGVEFNVPRDMDYEDPYQDLSIHLKAGPQLLDGNKAEQLVRFRHDYVDGDLGRIDVQSDFIRAAIEQIIHKSTSQSGTDTEELIRALADMVETDFDAMEMLEFAPYILSVNMDNINIMMLEGYLKDNSPYFYPDHSKNARLVKEYFTPEISEADVSEIRVRDQALGKAHDIGLTELAQPCETPVSEVSVYILDYSGTNGKYLASVQEKLTAIGYRVIGNVSAKTVTADRTYCISAPGNMLSSMVAKDLGLDKFYINNDADASLKADVVIILGVEPNGSGGSSSHKED